MAQLSSHGGSSSNNSSSIQEMVQVEVAVEVVVEVVVALEVVPQVHIAHVQALGVLLLPPLHSAVLGAHWMKAQHQTKAFSDCCS